MTFMRLTSWKLSAIISALLAAAPLEAAGRPVYGQVLRVETQGMLTELDSPLPGEGDDLSLRNRILCLVADRLVTLDDRGVPQPALAVSWESSADYGQWSFQLRSDAVFHDGTPVDPEAVAAILSSVQNEFRVFTRNRRVFVAADTALPKLLNRLASPAFAVLKKSNQGAIVGTGPFQIHAWQPPKVVLTAFEEYRAGRPFVDAVEITTGRELKDQMIDLELGRADIVEVALAEARRPLRNGRAISFRPPSELLALVFGGSRAGPTDSRLRESLALSIDRGSILSVLLRKQGEPTGALLPQWLTGYAFLFPTARDLAKARSLVPLSAPTQLALGYPADDVLLRSIAERIALDAQSIGLRIRTVGESGHSTLSDVRLVRHPIDSLDIGAALTDLAGGLRVPPSPGASFDTAQDAFDAEFSMLQNFRIIPLFHVPSVYAVSKRVRATRLDRVFRTGCWRLEDIWIVEETGRTN